MKKKFLLITLLFFPLFLHAQDLNEKHFFTASISAGVLFGPDFINTDERATSLGADIFFGRRLFFGVDFARNKMTFTDTKAVSGATGEFYILDGVAGFSLDLGLSRFCLGIGAGGYLCNYTGIPNASNSKGFAMNFFWNGYIKAYEHCNLGLGYKLYRLADAGWYSTIGVLACLSFEKIDLL